MSGCASWEFTYIARGPQERLPYNFVISPVGYGSTWVWLNLT